MMINILKKHNIASILIVALLINHIAFAGSFFETDVGMKYMYDDGSIATGWRWIDTNGDGICECYRFNENGVLATESVIKGKSINERGQWVVDGVVQQVFKSSGRPLYETNRAFAAKDTNKYIEFGTGSEITTKRINATKKDMKSLLEADANKDEEARLRSLVGPKAEFEKPKEGYLLGKNVKNLNRKKPVATRSTWYLIDDATKEDEIIYLSASESIVAGKDMREFVTASNKYTKVANNVKIWGGKVWNDVFVLQGNGAYAKFTTTESKKKSKFKANYFTVEVAHQTHGESTADTYCAIELYLNGNLVSAYDSFCDDEPEIIEEWLDDGESNIELRAIVTGDAPGRKIYLRNARFRQLRERNDE